MLQCHTVNIFRNQKFRKIIKKTFSIILPVFSTLFVLGTTALIVIIINGYSIDINKRTVIRTGVLNIETNPSDADIFINDTHYGKSNRAISNLPVGEYHVTVSKDGYHAYTRKVTILHGLATPLSVPLLKVNEKKEIVKLSQDDLIATTTTGYYILTKQQQLFAGETTETTGSPTPTSTQATQTTITYTLGRVHVTKPLFDTARPAIDEKMTITTFSATPITSISISPTGKLLYVVLTDKEGESSVSLIPFKKETTVNANLTDVRALTNYKRAKNTTLTWSDNGDYLIIETPTQIISYNVKSGSRVILAEKSEFASSGEKVIWSMTNTGIVLIKKAQGTATNTYEIVDISFNGNPLETQLPTLSFDKKPTHIWSFSETDAPRFIVATTAGTFVVGRIFDAKSADYDITLNSTAVDGVEIQHFTNDFSKFQISDKEITQKPLAITGKHLLAFFEDKNQTLFLFAYNKRTADKSTVLGKNKLLTQEQGFTELQSLAHGAYFLSKHENALIATDQTGENSITLQENVTSFALALNDSAILFTDDTRTLWFRPLR